MKGTAFRTLSPTAADTISPAAVQTPIHLAVTVTVSLFVGILFVFVYLQLCVVIYYGYRLVSYQTVLLFDILLWAALRLTLYSFYFFHCCGLVDSLSPFFEWLLVAFPSALQFITLAILVHYFGELGLMTSELMKKSSTYLHTKLQVHQLLHVNNLYRVYERRKEMSSSATPYKKLKMYRVRGWLMWLSSIITYLTCNVVFSVLVYLLCDENGNPNVLLVVLRVATLDGLFLIMGVTLAVCIMIMYTTKLGKDVLEAQIVHKWKPVIFSFVLFLLFVSRAIYDLITVTITVVNKEEMHVYGFGSSWMATDMADYEFKRKYGYVVYLSILFLWEVIPTYLIVIFFRVTFPFSAYRTLAQCIRCKKKSAIEVTQRRQFFDNPDRYDAETAEITGSLQRSSQLSIPHLPGPLTFSPSRAGYGSTARYPYSAPSKYSTNNTPSQSYMPGTTPPQLFTTSPSFLK